MKYEEAMEYIEECNTLGSVLGLESMERLMKVLHNPQEQLTFIHVAGTNGKGSVSSFVASVLKQAGYKVGRYISPTIFTYRERFQINDKMISKKELGELMEQVKEACGYIVSDGHPHPTSFEIETALSFLYFVKKECDVVVLETGMGGRLDATNIIPAEKLCVLTSISMDHMQFLGETLTEIATEKCGIIKEGTTVISTEQSEEAMNVVERTCALKKADLVVADSSKVTKVKQGLEKQSFSYDGTKYEILLGGNYQIENAVLAVEVVKWLSKNGFEKITEQKIVKGLQTTVWKGRFGVIAKKPYFIVDGAHNVAAAEKLEESIRFYFTNRKIVYIMGMFRDKEYEKVIRITAPLATQIITVAAPGNPRALPALELAEAVREVNPNVTNADSLEEAVEMSYLFADKESVIIAFGSLAFLGQLMTIVEGNQTVRSDTHGK